MAANYPGVSKPGYFLHISIDNSILGDYTQGRTGGKVSALRNMTQLLKRHFSAFPALGVVPQNRGVYRDLQKITWFTDTGGIRRNAQYQKPYAHAVWGREVT